MFYMNLYVILYGFWDYPINLEPSASSCFSLFLSFTEKEYQMESKRNKTFAMVFLGPEDTQDSWSVSQKSHEAAIRVEGAPRGVGRTLHPRGGLRTLLVHLECSVGFFWSKNNLREISGHLDSVWFSFSAILKNKETNRNWHWALG